MPWDATSSGSSWQWWLSLAAAAGAHGLVLGTTLPGRAVAPPAPGLTVPITLIEAPVVPIEEPPRTGGATGRAAVHESGSAPVPAPRLEATKPAVRHVAKELESPPTCAASDSLPAGHPNTLSEPAPTTVAAAAEIAIDASAEDETWGIGLRGAANGRGMSIGGLNGQGSDAAGKGSRTRRRPRLIARTARCSDLFPHDSRSASARVTVGVDVSQGGTTSRPRVLSLTPTTAGFQEAARLCAGRLRFSPATDRSGRAVAAHAVVRLGFKRN